MLNIGRDIPGLAEVRLFDLTPHSDQREDRMYQPRVPDIWGPVRA